MTEYFKNTRAKIEMISSLKYGNYRDWFVIDPNKLNMHETKIQFFINSKFLYKDMMPINTKNLNYIFESKVNFEINIKKFKWVIPEMDWEKETIFNNPAIVTHFDTFKIDGKINFEIGED